MKKGKLVLITLIVLVINLLIIFSCTKEYSCKACFIRDTIPSIDTTPPKDTTKIDSTINFAECSTCDSNQSFSLSEWSFRNYSSFLCGKIDTAGFDNGRHSFSFFGPSNCSKDTVLSITAFFHPLTFDTDKFDVLTKKVTFYYSANNVPNVILKAEPGKDTTMTIIIDSFYHSTGIMTGRIFGYTNTVNGDKTYISFGKFKTKIN